MLGYRSLHLSGQFSHQLTSPETLPPVSQEDAATAAAGAAAASDIFASKHFVPTRSLGNEAHFETSSRDLRSRRRRQPNGSGLGVWSHSNWRRSVHISHSQTDQSRDHYVRASAQPLATGYAPKGSCAPKLNQRLAPKPLLRVEPRTQRLLPAPDERPSDQTSVRHYSSGPFGFVPRAADPFLLQVLPNVRLLSLVRLVPDCGLPKAKHATNASR